MAPRNSSPRFYAEEALFAVSATAKTCINILTKYDAMFGGIIEKNLQRGFSQYRQFHATYCCISMYVLSLKKQVQFLKCLLL